MLIKATDPPFVHEALCNTAVVNVHSDCSSCPRVGKESKRNEKKCLFLIMHLVGAGMHNVGCAHDGEM